MKTDAGVLKVLIGGSSSPNPRSQSVVAGYEKLINITKSDADVSHLLEGEIPFGFFEDGAVDRKTIARLELSYMPRHCFIMGPSGSGKSNLARILANELTKYIPVMIFDRTGDHLNVYPDRLFTVIPIQHLRINPNEPPAGVPYDQWLELYSSVLIHSLILTDVSRGTFIQLLRYSNEAFANKKKDLFCSIFEQKQAIGDLRPKLFRDYARNNYWGRLEDRYDTMVTSALGDIFGCYRGHDIVDMLSRNVVFDCKGISSHILRVVIPMILLKIYTCRLYNDQGGKLLHATVLEEAENIFFQANGGFLLENPLDDLVRRIRGRGESLIVINQTCTTISSALRSNVYMQFMLGATNNRERTEMGRSIGLRENQWEEALNLHQPNAFVSIEGKEPRLVSIPEYKLPKTVNENIKLISSPEDIPYVPVDQGVKDDVLNFIFTRNRTQTMKKIKKSKEVTQFSKIVELMTDIADNPFVPLTSRKSLSFGNSRSELFVIMEKAIEKKYVRQITAKANRGPGQKGIYLELTKKGLEALIENDRWKEGKPYYRGKMGFAGSLLLHGLIIPYYEEAGYIVEIEGIDKGFDCDLGVLGKDGSLECAVELSVTTDAKHEAKNIIRNLNSGWKSVLSVVVAFDRKSDFEHIENDIKSSRKAEQFLAYFQDVLDDNIMQKVKVAEITEFRSRRKK